MSLLSPREECSSTSQPTRRDSDIALGEYIRQQAAPEIAELWQGIGSLGQNQEKSLLHPEPPQEKGHQAKQDSPNEHEGEKIYLGGGSAMGPELAPMPRKVNVGASQGM